MSRENNTPEETPPAAALIRANLTAREACYADIINSTSKALDRYYRIFPDRAGDDRSRDGMSWSRSGLDEIFRILDAYEIHFRGESHRINNEDR